MEWLTSILAEQPADLHWSTKRRMAILQRWPLGRQAEAQADAAVGKPSLREQMVAEIEAIKAAIPANDVSLDSLKAIKNGEINAARAKANGGTFAYAGKSFACDALSRGDIDGVNGYVALSGELPPGFPGAWKAVDNTYLSLTDVVAWTGFYAAMVASGAANFSHAQQLKAALAAATTPKEVAAIVW